jgi:hypothetical protein
MEMKFFKAVPGYVVRRYGSSGFIGVTRTADGWEWYDSATTIPLNEYQRYGREYKNALRSGALVEVSERDIARTRLTSGSVAESTDDERAPLKGGK